MEVNLKENKVPWNAGEAVLIVLAAIFLGIIITLCLSGMGLKPVSSIGKGILQAVLSSLPLILIIYAIKTYYKVPIIKSLGLSIESSDNLKTYFFGGVKITALIIFSTLFINMLFYTITKTLPENPYSKFSLEDLKMIAVLAVIIAPVFEELVFRGFLQPAFCKAIGNYQGTVVVSLIFAIIHLNYIDYPSAFVSMVILALILGFTRLYYNSTIPGIVGHFLNNLIASIVILMGPHV